MAAELEEAKKPTLERLYDGSKQQLLLESGVFSNLTDHAGEKGRANEDHLRRILRGFLPGKMGLGTGFVEAPGNVRSKQQDIVIWEQLNNFPLYEGESWSIYPVECVYGTIEVKTQINSALLKESLDACAQIREMAKGKCYLIENEGATKAVEYLRRIHDLPPRFFIVAYRSA